MCSMQVCGSRARQRSVYVSETNRIEAVIMSSKLDDEPVYFLLKYEGTITRSRTQTRPVLH